MKVSELQKLIGAENLTPEVAEDREITCGYACDLLSWVMAHGDEGMAWVTVQTHMNVVAVAVLSDMACIVLPEGIRMEAESLQKAKDEGMTVLTSRLTAYEICGRLFAQGVPAHE
ncbi:MAG: AraC family transcriptional regulator [Clostridia bacterium]|nr:AraC family transcriptional regulator [Clostridia bacterium]